MQDTNIVIRAAVEGYIVSVNSPSQNLLDAAANEPHIFLSLADVITFLTGTVLVEPVQEEEDVPVADSAPAASGSDAATDQTVEAVDEAPAADPAPVNQPA